jgi:DNA polymerase epsilon subunit 1
MVRGISTSNTRLNYAQPNHLLGHPRLYLKLMFRNVTDLLTVRRDIVPLALANSAKMNAVDAYAEVVNAEAAAASLKIMVDGDDVATTAWSMDVDGGNTKKGAGDRDPREGIIDVREFDVPYYLRVAIDKGMSS